MKHRNFKPSLRPLGFLLIGSFAFGCGGNTPVPDVCANCIQGEQAFVCSQTAPTVCDTDEESACGIGVKAVSATHCLHLGTDTGSYPDWNPSDEITYNSSTDEYEVDESLINEVLTDGYVLMAEEGVRLIAQQGGYYELKDVTTGDLADLLGFQNGDVLKDAQGSGDRHSLEDWDGYAAFILDASEDTSFTIWFTRNGSTMSQDYVVVSG